MKIPAKFITVGQVLSEDNAFMTVEICKDETRELQINDGDQFFTLVFVKTNDDGSLSVWKPWE